MATGFKLGSTIRTIKDRQNRDYECRKSQIKAIIKTLIFVSIIRFIYVLPLILNTTAGDNKIHFKNAIVQRYSAPVPTSSKITRNVRKLSSKIIIPLRKHMNWVNSYPLPKKIDSAFGGINNLTGLKKFASRSVYVIVAILGFVYQILFLLFVIVIGILGAIIEFIIIKAWYLFNYIGIIFDVFFPKVPVLLVWYGVFIVGKLLSFMKKSTLRTAIKIAFYGGLIWIWFYSANLPTSIGIPLDSIYK